MTDEEIQKAAFEAWRDRVGPRVGDFIELPSGLGRFAEAWDDRFQTCYGGSFFMGESGRASFSGGLNPSIPADRFEETGRMKQGAFWHFRDGFPGMGRGVTYHLPCRVYRLRSER